EVAHIARRVCSDAALREVTCLGGVSGVQGQFREELVRCGRIALFGKLSVLTGPRGLALERVDAREREMRLGLERIEREHLPECREPFGRVPRFDQRLRERLPGVEHPRIRGNDAAQFGDRFCVASAVGETSRVLDALELSY